MTDIRDLTLAGLTEELKIMGQPSFRAGQVFSWLHRGVTSFSEMTNVPATLREALSERFTLEYPEVERRQVSQLDGTIKYLWRLTDGNCIETVLMRYRHGNTVCISSQVGCRMGCAFCASTLGGLVRSLRPHELLNQVIFTGKDAGLPVSNIVLMGIGEP
ncbi:MAG: 23S rRNA (adenine(2503)-C(2))-methyltransferase RlmN, partial [Clostridia bacterium]|nr:23S rRNA (adenine(2503)-C(2))-methyltransferase RlmN [Clostridia bacterium]